MPYKSLLYTNIYYTRISCQGSPLKIGMLGQIILAAVVDSKLPDSGHIQRWDMNTGVSLGLSLKEYYTEAGIAGVTLYPSNSSLHTPALVALNRKNASLNYYITGKERPAHRFFGQDRLCTICISPNSSYLVAGNEEGKLFAWDITTGEMIIQIDDAHLQRVTCIGFTTDGGILVSSSADGTVKVWPWESLVSGGSKPLKTLTDHTNIVSDIHVGFGIDRNCRLVSACQDKMVRIYDLVDFQLLATFEFPSPIRRVLLSLTETAIYAGCEDGNIYLVDLASDPQEALNESAISYHQQCSRVLLTGHKSPITSLQLSIDETCLISGDDTGMIIVWCIATRQVLRRISADGPVRWIGIVHKGSFEAALNQKHKLIVGQPTRSRPQEPAKWICVEPLKKESIITSVNSTEFDELKVAYSKLVGFLLSKYQ